MNPGNVSINSLIMARYGDANGQGNNTTLTISSGALLMENAANPSLGPVSGGTAYVAFGSD